MIGTMEASRIYAGLTWTRFRRGKLLWVAAILMALPVVGAAGLFLGGFWGRGTFDDLLEVYFRFLIPFVPVLLASNVVAEEIENRTFTFLFARPAPRSALVLGKYFTVVVPTLLAVTVSIALSWALVMARFPEDFANTATHFLRVELAAALGVCGYAGLAVLLGSWFTRHPFVGVLGYLLVIELGLASAPIVLNVFAMSWHLRNLAELPLPSLDSVNMTISVAPEISAIIPLVWVGLGLGLGSLAVSGAEYHAKD